MTAGLNQIIQDLKNSISELESNLSHTFIYKSNIFYRKKFNKSINSFRIHKLKLEQIAKTQNFNSNIALQKIILLVCNLIEKTPTTRNEISELLDKIQILLSEIEISFEDKDISEIVYDVRSHFDFYVDIKEIMLRATTDLFVIDSWIDDNLLEVYLKKLNPSLKIKVLTNTNNPKGSFLKIGNLFKSQYKNFEARESQNIHDRAVFCDDREGWVMGQSIKDAAKNKPTYLIQLKNPAKLKSVYEQIWSASKKLI